MELLNKVMKYLFRSNDVPQCPESCEKNTVSVAGSTVNAEHDKGAKVAAIVAAMHHHAHANNDDVRAKVAAIAAALHHHELESAQGNNALFGVAAVVAAIHHHNKTKQ